MDEQEIQQQNIEQVVNDHTNANVYTLNNLYLTPAEKGDVEMWYQLPGDIMFITFVLTAIYSTYNPLPWSEIIGIPLVVNVLVGIWCWCFYSKKVVMCLYLTILNGWISYIIGIVAAIFFFTQGAIIFATISLIMPFGLLVFMEPHIYFYSILAQKYRMHPKYVFFKKEYGYKFPFEASL
jgi:hypothetical protein